MTLFRRTPAALALCLGLAAATLVPAAPAAAGLHPPYALQSPGSHYSFCIDVANAAVDNGTRIQQWPCNQTRAQLWSPFDQVMVGNTAYYELLSEASPNGSPKCIEVPWGNPAPGQALELWDCLGAARQLWSMTWADSSVHNWVFENLQTHQCIDVPWNVPVAGGALQQWPCHRGEPQQWRPLMP